MRILLVLIASLLCFQVPAQWSPPGAPTMTYTWGDSNAICEHLFLGTLTFQIPAMRNATNMMLDSRGDVAWYNQSAESMFDFKVHPNGEMTFFSNGEWQLMDTSFNIVNTLTCDGLTDDIHDIIVTNQGTYIIICFEDTIVDLSGVLTRNGQPGSPTATLSANVIQELDGNGQVIKSWHALDHFNVTDFDTVWFSQPNFMELNHTNSIAMNEDGLMLLSHRFNHEVTLIDWNTGQIKWRLGGPHNQFSFGNDTGLSAQHDARFAGPNRISVFDNGTYHDPPRARGIIYELDTIFMTATKVWEYADQSITSTSMGSFRVLPNGDGLVNFGAFSPPQPRNIAYVRADSSKVLDIDLQDSYWTYRAQCFDLPFDLDRPRLVCEEIAGQLQLSIAGTHSSYRWRNGATTPTVTVTDTGYYQVFVPRGIGMVGSNVLHITNLNATCQSVSQPEVSVGTRPPRLIGTYDLLGRPVLHRRPGELYIERYDNGASRKIYMQ